MGKQRVKKKIKKESTRVKEIDIWLLIDAIYYFLNKVIIVPIEDFYRLYVISTTGIEHCIDYDTVKGAKIGFANLYRTKIHEVAKSQKRGKTWRHIPVDLNWLNRLISDKKY